MPFFDLPKPIYYLPTYLLIDLKNNNPKNDFNLCVKLTQSNGPLSIIQIVSHFVSHSAIQNDKVQFDYLVALNMYKMTCPY